MPAFEWKKFFSVGHAAMDAQHKRLFDIVNELYDGMKQSGSASDELLGRTIAALCDYTRTHFADEEQLLLVAGYPDFLRHKQSHDALIGKVEEFEARMRNGEVRLAAEVLPFLVGEWLSSHIAFEDQQYAGYLNRQNGGLRQKHRAAMAQDAEKYALRLPRAELVDAW